MSLTHQLDDLKRDVVLMARRADEIFEKALECLERRDPALVAEVRAIDAEIDELEIEIDRKCIALLALQDPFAVDFRFVFSVVKTIRDIERVGDESKTIAKWSPRMPEALDDDLRKLAASAREALRTATRAFVENDRKIADAVLDIEFQVDEIEERIVGAPGTSLPRAFIAKALERIGDLATNIAENVIFTVSAQDIRHGHFENT